MKALAVISAMLFALLGVIVGWFALQGDREAGEPVVVITLEEPDVRPAAPRQIGQSADGRVRHFAIGGNDGNGGNSGGGAEPPTRQAPGERDGDTGGFRIPPGFSVEGLEPQSDSRAAPTGPDDGAPDRAARAPASNGAQAPGGAQAQGEPPQLTAAPVTALVQDSRYGPLPRIGDDGRQPSEVYARPTAYDDLPRRGEPLRIALLIGDMGLSESVTADAIAELPPAVTLAFGPYSRDPQDWVDKARAAGHEVMLQVPMEPFDYPDNDPGPHTLLSELPHDENLTRLHWLMARFTGYTGVTNHMGAKFAAAQAAFLPVLEEVASRGLIYLDDGTSVRSDAAGAARDKGLGFAAAHVAIDASQDPQDIDAALARLEELARETGIAIGIGAAQPATVARVAHWARALEDKGAVLVPVSAAVRAQRPS